jgi:GTP pyrophosphokinase
MKLTHTVAVENPNVNGDKTADPSVERVEQIERIVGSSTNGTHSAGVIMPPARARLLRPGVHSPVPPPETEGNGTKAENPLDLDCITGLSKITIDTIVARLRTYMPDGDSDLVRRAYVFACIAHQGQMRESGEPYITHPVEVSRILLDLHMDDCAVAAALLHDVAEDTDATLEDIEQEFGEEIASLVNGVTKLSVLESQSKEEAQACTYRKMFIAMADDPRVVLIKLADRVHNMRTIGARPPQKQRKVARETLEIYAPLAHRLGIWRIKSELEDRAFKSLSPERYHEIARQLMLRRDAREHIILRLIARLEEELEREGIQADISGRPKHIYSIHRKMERKGVGLDQIYDLLAVRVIVNDVSECYRVLGIVHSIWTPVLTEFDDYIAVPKESMYRSLHTTVIIPDGTPCEVQIRTYEMHAIAEHGIAAHWRYKEGIGSRESNTFEAKLAWLRGLIGWRREMTDAREFIESLKSDEFEEQVYVFSPKGKIIDLPIGSTPVDFAYRIHSEVGQSCTGAKVNGRMVSLDYQLKSGEIVTILTSRQSRGPSRDWLNFVKTSNARSHIKRYFRRLQRGENITAGRHLLEKEMKRLGMSVSFDEVVSVIDVGSVEELFALIGSGETTARAVVQKVLALEEAHYHDDLSHIPQFSHPSDTDTSGIRVCGTGNVLTRIAMCCNPVPGEPIVGYVTQGRGVSVHRADCRMILKNGIQDRLVDVSWGDSDPRGYPVPIYIESWDRVGLWRDISAMVADAGINIEQLQQVRSRRDGHVVLTMQLKIQSIRQLSEVLDRINRIPNVIEVRRESSGTS